MKLRDLQDIFHKELDEIYGKNEVNSFFYMLTEAFYSVSRIELALAPEITISKAEQNPVFDALNRLKKQEPIQYILKETVFYGLKFKVNENTLIPRPETEELVDWIIKSYDNKEALRVLDVGTGTGCIAIALAKHFPRAKMTAIDVSHQALCIARENAKQNNVTVNFIERDILQIKNIFLGIDQEYFDVIVSNPPYVRKKEKEQMRTNVLEYEPHLALFVENDDPLVFYDAISQFAINNLKKKGDLFFEINEYLGEEMVMLLKNKNFKNIVLKKDIFGADRMLKGTKMYEELSSVLWK